MEASRLHAAKLEANRISHAATRKKYFLYFLFGSDTCLARRDKWKQAYRTPVSAREVAGLRFSPDQTDELRELLYEVYLRLRFPIAVKRHHEEQNANFSLPVGAPRM